MADTAVVERQDDSLLALAIEKGLDTDKLEKLIELRNREIERRAKSEYDTHFAEMQKDYSPVGRSREVKSEDGRKVLYSFCPLEDILVVYQPIITHHGFSFRWAEESLENGMKRIWCIVAGYGHEERSYVDIPIQVGTKFTNSIQQRGVSTSYGKRYSFVNAFGVIIAGEDNDTRSNGAGEDSRGGASNGQASGGSSGVHASTIPTGPMSFQGFIKVINEVVPSTDRPEWMKKAQGGKDPALLAKLAAEIRAAYGGEAPPAAAPDQARIRIMEYIQNLVPADERWRWTEKLEAVEHKLEPLASFYIALQTQYGDPGLFEE